MNITSRIEHLETAAKAGQATGLPPQTLQTLLNALDDDPIANFLCRESQTQANHLSKSPPWPAEGREIMERLDIVSLWKTEDGRREARRRLRAEASKRYHALMEPRFGSEVTEWFLGGMPQ